MTTADAGPSAQGPAPTPAAAVLELRDVAKAYGGVQAVRGVSLAVRPGEVLALLGENGAGKSTVVGMAAGRVQPDAGDVLVDGRSVLGGGPGAAGQAGVRLVPQELLLCPDMTVLDNVLLGQRPRRWGAVLDTGEARREATRRLADLGVTHLDLDTPVALLPVVDQAFVQIARSFTPTARVLLIDEPTAPMDDADVARFLDVLRAMTARDIAIVYISHRLDEVFRLADRVAVLRDGRLVAQLSGEEMTRQRVVQEMVGSGALREAVPAPGRPADDVIALECRGLAGPGVRDLSFRLGAGEIATVYGITGSGRDRLGALVVGADRRTGGEVLVHGRQLRAGSVAAAVESGVGYVPAERRSQGLVLESSVAANLTLAVLGRLSRWGFLRDRTLTRAADGWIATLKVRTPGAAVPVGALSGGSQQKVLLARWLAAGSRVLVLEEPTRGVDIATKAEIYRLLHDVARQGAAVLVLTSDIEEASLVAERVMVMRHGRLSAHLTSPTQHEIALAAQGATEDT